MHNLYHIILILCIIYTQFKEFYENLLFKELVKELLLKFYRKFYITLIEKYSYGNFYIRNFYERGFSWKH